MKEFSRRVLERVSQRLVLRRKLPARFGGATLFVTPRAALAYFRSFHSTHWRELFDFAEFVVRPGDVVWDIGANLGVFAFAAAHRAGPHGAVLAVEADPWLCSLIRRSAAERAAPKVQSLCAALSSGVDLQFFETPERALSGSHLHTSPGAGDDFVGATVASHPVVTLSLDWLAKRSPAPRVIKIDVEGSELEVLRGGRDLLQSHRPVLLIEVFESSADKITTLLKAHGYELYNFEDGWHKRRPVTRACYHTLALPAPASP